MMDRRECLACGMGIAEHGPDERCPPDAPRRTTEEVVTLVRAHWDQVQEERSREVLAMAEIAQRTAIKAFAGLTRSDIKGSRKRKEMLRALRREAKSIEAGV